MSATTTTKVLPYHVFDGGLSVGKKSHDEEGDWYPLQGATSKLKCLLYKLQGYKLWIAMSDEETGSNNKLFNRMIVDSDRPVGSDR
jgi:hypothetical protein